GKCTGHRIRAKADLPSYGVSAQSRNSPLRGRAGRLVDRFKPPAAPDSNALGAWMAAWLGSEADHSTRPSPDRRAIAEANDSCSATRAGHAEGLGAAADDHLRHPERVTAAHALLSGLGGRFLRFARPQTAYPLAVELHADFTLHLRRRDRAVNDNADEERHTEKDDQFSHDCLRPR